MPPSILPKAIRESATILECEETARTTDTIVAAVMCRLNPTLDLLGHMTNKAQEAIKDTRQVADHLYRMGEDTRDEIYKGMDAVKEDM